MLLNGEGVAVNKQEAIRLYKMAINEGDPAAMFNYALALHDGNGVPVNKKEAARYFRMAADKGYKNALKYL